MADVAERPSLPVRHAAAVRAEARARVPRTDMRHPLHSVQSARAARPLLARSMIGLDLCAFIPLLFRGA